jgi:hypothetical protein
MHLVTPGCALRMREAYAVPFVQPSMNHTRRIMPHARHMWETHAGDDMGGASGTALQRAKPIANPSPHAKGGQLERAANEPVFFRERAPLGVLLFYGYIINSISYLKVRAD